MVVIDTDVMLLEFAYHRDVRQALNKDFWSRVMNVEPATTLYNLMEFLGHWMRSPLI